MSTIETHGARFLLKACLLLALSFAILALLPAFSSAYEGPFCENVGTVEGGSCTSVERSKIRRAIGHVENSYSRVRIATNVETREGSCFGSLGCESNTGYASADGTGHGTIWNEGPNGKKPAYGYLYE